MSQHTYLASIRWTGNRGDGNASYRGYDRTWDIRTPGKPVIQCSNDPLIGGDPSRPNPEDLLLASLSACHMLWYLHLAYDAGIVVLGYDDDPLGVGEMTRSGSGRFLHVTLRPKVRLRPGTDVEPADALHQCVENYCFVARSVNFPVRCEATYSHG